MCVQFEMKRIFILSQVKQEVEKMPRSQRKESMKIKLNNFQQMKSDQVSYRLEGWVHFQIKMTWSLTHPHVIQDVYVFLQWKRNEGFWWKRSRNYLHIVRFNGLQTVEGQH